MKKLILSFLVLFIGSASAQKTANLIIFNEEPLPFFVYVNGVKQNAYAEEHVKMTGLSSNVSIRIEFEDKSIPPIKQTVALEPGFELTARIRKEKNNQLKLRYFNQEPLETISTDAVTSQTYHTAENPETDEKVRPRYNRQNQNPGHKTVTSSTTTTSQTNSNTGSTSSVVVVAPGVGITMKVDPNIPGNAQSTTSTTVTTTTTQTQRTTNREGSGGNVRTGKHQPAPATVETGCKSAMPSANFNKLKESVAAKPFSDTKMSTAKMATKNSCLSVNQIKEIMDLFHMDDDRLTYAKFAYDHCVDKANYYQVSDAFSFSSSTEELSRYLDSK